MWDLWCTKWRWAGFLRVLRFPLPIFIPPVSRQSPSPIICGWYNRPVVAAVPRDSVSTPTKNKIKKLVSSREWRSVMYFLRLIHSATSLTEMYRGKAKQIRERDVKMLANFHCSTCPNKRETDVQLGQAAGQETFDVGIGRTHSGSVARHLFQELELLLTLHLRTTNLQRSWCKGWFVWPTRYTYIALNDIVPCRILLLRH
jgi:hypothetical protein